MKKDFTMRIRTRTRSRSRSRDRSSGMHASRRRLFGPIPSILWIASSAVIGGGGAKGDNSNNTLSSLMDLDELRATLNDTSALNVSRRVANVDVVSAEAASRLGEEEERRMSELFGDHDEIALCHLPILFRWSPHVDLSIVALAAQHLNTGNGSIVPAVSSLADGHCNVRFTFETMNTWYSAKRAVDQVIELTDREPSPPGNPDGPLPCAILGMSNSGMSIPTAIITGLRGYPQVSYQATSSRLNSASDYPLFGRTVPSDDGASVSIIMYYSRVLGVRYLAVFHVDDPYGNAYGLSLKNAAAEVAPGMTVTLISVRQGAKEREIAQTVTRLKDTGSTYFFGIVYGDTMMVPYMKEAYRQGIAGTGKHNYMFSDSIGGWIGRNYKHPADDEIRKALMGSATVSAMGGLAGMEKFDKLSYALRNLTDEDVMYLQLKFRLPNMWKPRNKLARAPDMYDPLLYDATIALGLAACKAADAAADGKYFTGKEHFSAMVNSVFEGVSGLVEFDNKTGTRKADSAMYSITNYVKDDDKSTHNVTKYKGVRSRLFLDGEWTELNPFVYNDGTEKIAEDLLPVTLEEDHLSTWMRAGGLIMCGLVFFQAFFFATWMHRYRKSRVIIASQPLFLRIVCLGTVIMGATIIPLSVDTGVASERGCDIACMSFPWLLFIGFDVTFSALFTKTHRINRIFLNPRFKRITVTTKDVMVPMVIMLAANILVLGLWTGLSPLKWETEIVRQDKFGRSLEIYGSCESEQPVPYIVTLLVFNLGTLLYSMFEAYRARKISTEFAESEYIFRAMAFFFLVSFVGIPVLIIAKDNREAFFFVLSAIIFVACTAVLCFIFVPKMIAHRRKQKEKEAAQKAKEALRTEGTFNTAPTISRWTEDLSESSTHEMGIKVMEHPETRREMEEENRRLQRELAKRLARPPAARSVPSVCPHCRASLMEESFHNEEGNAEGCVAAPLVSPSSSSEVDGEAMADAVVTKGGEAGKGNDDDDGGSNSGKTETIRDSGSTISGSEHQHLDNEEGHRR